MDGVAVKPLTVGFHETPFLTKLNQENQFGFWFQLSDEQRQQVGSPWGPANPQALNRYSYVQNNPLKYTDPSGHLLRSGPMTREDIGNVRGDVTSQIVQDSLVGTVVAGGCGAASGGAAGVVCAGISSLIIASLQGADNAMREALYLTQNMKDPRFVLESGPGGRFRVHMYDDNGDYMGYVESASGGYRVLQMARRYAPVFAMANTTGMPRRLQYPSGSGRPCTLRFVESCDVPRYYNPPAPPKPLGPPTRAG